MGEKNPWINYEYDYNSLYEGIRYRPGMYFGSVDLSGLHNAIMDLIHYCVENQKNDIGVVINGSDITILHKGEELASSFDTDVVKAACEIFNYDNNQFQFRFDKEIFVNIEPNSDTLFDSIRELAFLNMFLKISFNEHCFYYKNGLMDFYQYLKIRAYYWRDKHPPISLYAKEGDLELDAVFSAVESMDPCTFSFVNNCKTEDNGAHVNGFLSGLREAAYKYKQNSDEYKKTISKNDVALIIHIKTPNPQYAGSTKRQISNPEIYQFVKKITRDKLSRIFAENPEIALKYLKWWQYL